jgi:hypothetical protein
MPCRMTDGFGSDRLGLGVGRLRVPQTDKMRFGQRRTLEDRGSAAIALQLALVIGMTRTGLCPSPLVDREARVPHADGRVRARATILPSVGPNAERPAGVPRAVWSDVLVAGTGFEPVTFRL